MSLDPSTVLQAAQRPMPSPGVVGGWRRQGVCVLGGGGSLGAAVLHELMARGGFARVEVVTHRPMSARPRGLHDLCLTGEDDVRWSTLETHAAVAVMVFDVPKARESGLYMPQPEDVLPIARRLKALGVRCWVVVMPHAPARLPAALRDGLWSLAEADWVALGFEHLLLVRPASGGLTSTGRTWTPGWRGWGERLADWMLSNLRYMVPTRHQPVRVENIATLVRSLIQALEAPTPAGPSEAAAGGSNTWVVSAETVWAAAQPGALAATVARVVGRSVDQPT